MSHYQVEKTFSASPQEIWDIVQNYQDSSWRRNIVSVTENEQSYSELHKETGYASTYKIEEVEKYKRIRTSIQHIDGEGERVILLESLDNGQTKVKIEENFSSHNKLLQPLINRFFKKQLVIYLEDLQMKLKEK